MWLDKEGCLSSAISLHDTEFIEFEGVPKGSSFVKINRNNRAAVRRDMNFSISLRYSPLHICSLKKSRSAILAYGPHTKTGIYVLISTGGLNQHEWGHPVV